MLPDVLALLSCRCSDFDSRGFCIFWYSYVGNQTFVEECFKVKNKLANGLVQLIRQAEACSQNYSLDFAHKIII